MSNILGRVRSAVSGDGSHKRRIGVLLLLILVLLGLGIGTFDSIEEGENSLPGVHSETPVPTVEMTPTPTPAPTPTPTPVDNGSGASGGSSGAGLDGDDSEEVDPDSSDDSDVSDDSDDSDGSDGSDDSQYTPSDDGQDHNYTGDNRAEVTVNGSRFEVRMTDVLPGDDGEESVTVTNSGNASGEFAGKIDRTGKLWDHLLVRLSVTHNGTTEYLLGSAGSEGYVPLNDSVNGTKLTADGVALEEDEEATLTFEWKLPSSTGNEAQNTAARFDVSVILETTS